MAINRVVVRTFMRPAIMGKVEQSAMTYTGVAMMWENTVYLFVSNYK